MTINSDVQVGWEEIANRRCVKITFTGHLTKDKALKAAIDWRVAMTETDNMRTPIVFNCKHMTNYDPMARVVWQNTMNDLKGQIGDLWVVTDSKLIVAGAAILGMFSSLKIHTTDLESKVFLN